MARKGLDYQAVHRFKNEIGKVFERLKADNPDQVEEIEEALRKLVEEDLGETVQRVEEPDDEPDDPRDPNFDDPSNKGA